MKTIRGFLLAALVLALSISCGKTTRTETHETGHAEAGHDEEGHVELSAESRAASGVVVEAAGPRALQSTIDLPGEIVPNADRLAHIVPRFPGIARQVRKSLGESVAQDEVLAVIEGNQSLETYEVRSLIAGTVIEKHVTLGEFLRDDADIYVIANLSTVWVDVAVYARDVARIRRGQSAIVEAVGQGLVTRGVIEYVGPVVGEATRTATARIELANPGLRWRPGTFVTARIVTDETPAAVAVPTAAVQQVEGRDGVFVEDGDGFAFRPVVRGVSDGEWVAIASGLAAGERYVTRGAFILKSELQKSEAGHDH